MKFSEKDKQTVKNILDEFITPFQARVALATERQIKFFAHEKVDACPIQIYPEEKSVETVNKAVTVPEGSNIQDEFMRVLLLALRENARSLMSNSDSIISVFPAFGCSASLSALGLEQKREAGGGYGPPDALSQDEALKLTLDDVRLRGDFKKRIDFIKYARTMLDDRIPVLCSYVGGPFPLACGLMGTDFMMLTATDPELAHEFLDFCSEAQKKLLVWLRDAAGADDCKNTILGGKSVVRGSRAMQIDIDEAVMFSPAAIDEFIIPHTCDFAKRCGLNIEILHYCGWYEYFSRAIAGERSIRSLNNNPVSGKEHDAPFEEVMKFCSQTNTTYKGYWPIFDDEHPKDYLKRLNKWAKEGVLFPYIITDIYKSGYFASAAEIADYWYQL